MIENKIVQFIHCSKCLEELPEEISPMDYARIQFGWTDKGFQVWCNRHDLNVGCFDLRGNKVAFDTNVKECSTI